MKNKNSNIVSHNGRTIHNKKLSKEHIDAIRKKVYEDTYREMYKDKYSYHKNEPLVSTSDLITGGAALTALAARPYLSKALQPLKTKLANYIGSKIKSTANPILTTIKNKALKVMPKKEEGAFNSIQSIWRYIPKEKTYLPKSYSTTKFAPRSPYSAKKFETILNKAYKSVAATTKYTPTSITKKVNNVLLKKAKSIRAIRNRKKKL